MDRKIEYGVIVAVILVFFLGYGYGETTVRRLTQDAGYAGLTLIGLAFIVGPLSRFSQRVAAFKQYRKTWGLTGFVLSLAHGIGYFGIAYKWDAGVMFASDNFLAAALGILALLIFAVMALASNQTAVQKLGYANWKKLQTCGYLALFLALAHIVLFVTPAGAAFPAFRRPLGWFILAFGALVLFVRVLVACWPAKLPEPKKFDDHVTPLAPVAGSDAKKP